MPPPKSRNTHFNLYSGPLSELEHPPREESSSTPVDMDTRPSRDSNHPESQGAKPRRSMQVTGEGDRAALSSFKDNFFAQFAAAASEAPPQLLPQLNPLTSPLPPGYTHSYSDQGFNRSDAGPTQPPSLSPLDFLWHSFSPRPPANLSPQESFAIPQMALSNTGTAYHPTAVSAPSTESPPSNTSSPDLDYNEVEHIANEEEKRRRNTAASARFRIKKKQKSINLERSVSDLTSRADDLEREAADLRRENGWLKEIVMLKSSRINLANHISAETSQRIAEALQIVPSDKVASESKIMFDEHSSAESTQSEGDSLLYQKKKNLLSNK